MGKRMGWWILMLLGSTVALATDNAFSQSSFEANSNNRNDLLDAFGPTQPSADLFGSVPEAITRERDPFEFAAAATAALEIAYDTGDVRDAQVLRPVNIALDGTPAARGRGRYNMFATGSLLEVQIAETETVANATGRIELDLAGIRAEDLGTASDGVLGITGSSFRLRRAYGIIDASDYVKVLVGQDYTTFQDNKALPVSVLTDGTPAGAVFRRVPQLRVTGDMGNGITSSFAIENPTSTDFVLPDPGAAGGPPRDVRLRRVPDLVANMHYVDPCNSRNRAQLAAVVRWVGYEDVTGDENFVTGWGVTGSTRFAVTDNDNISFGAVVGEGLGDFLFGFAGSESRSMNAAGPVVLGGNIVPWTTVGCHLGYQHRFNSRLQGNAAYGYAFADTELIAPADVVVRKSQNTWVNLILRLNENTVIGLEYQFGRLDVTDLRYGENNRIQMTFQIHTPKSS